jgi:hypothetical protein
VQWLERVAASAAFARNVQGDRPIGTAKALRVQAYARLGELGTRESLAAVERIERQLAAEPLTPAVVPLDEWTFAAPHIADIDWTAPDAAFVAAPPRNGITYAVVSASLLGGDDLFLISTGTPADRASWTRPKLIAPLPSADRARAALAWRGPRTLLYSVEPQPLQIVLDDVERDSDGDGWTDLEEARIGTNPHAIDSDDDGISDGRDVCPLFAKPPRADDAAQILQTAVFAAFAMTGSRQMLYVTPGTPRVHLSGYGGPVIFDRAVPKTGDGGGAVYVSWNISSRSDTDANVEITDWEGPLAASGQDVTLKRTAGRWVVVAVRLAWVS